MADLRLPHHIHYCESGGQRIFLDLLADRYFSLPPAADAAFAALGGGDPSLPSAELDGLARLGLLVEAPEGRAVEPTRQAAPGSSLVEEADLAAEFSLRVTAEVLVLILRARRLVKRKRLPAELGRRLRSPGCIRQNAERRDRAVTAFLRARRLLPIAPGCLHDSLALRRFLARRSIGCDLVIGVKLHPFQAHCWVQDGTMVLNDSLGAALDFTPILVA